MDPKSVKAMEAFAQAMHVLNMQYLQLLLRCGVQDPVLHRF